MPGDSETCTNCGATILGMPFFVKWKVVCQRCHDLLQPQCPYCGEYLRRSKIAERRSSFKCRVCGEGIHVEPTQWLYDSPYLTDEQLGYLGFLEQLDRWVFALGSRSDYERMRATLREKFRCEPGIGDVLWGLMNQSIHVLGEEHNEELRQLRTTFGGAVPGNLARTSIAMVEMRDVRKLMREFREFEREVKAARKARKRRTRK